MTWEQILADPILAKLDYRIESDRWGNIVISPPPKSSHAEYQAEIAFILRTLLKRGRSVTECPIKTTEGTKACDVAWVSLERRASRKNDPVYVIAPEICVEVESPSNSSAELAERRQLYFEKGAVECWICDLFGRMTFYDPAGELDASRLCSDFPGRVRLPPLKRAKRRR